MYVLKWSIQFSKTKVFPSIHLSAEFNWIYQFLYHTPYQYYLKILPNFEKLKNNSLWVDHIFYFIQARYTGDFYFMSPVWFLTLMDYGESFTLPLTSLKNLTVCCYLSPFIWFSSSYLFSPIWLKTEYTYPCNGRCIYFGP